ncbi:MAG: FAD-dependent oxidoreductase [Acidobacteria bacterium]|nr:FAD-dependent oxidoreductase [Acidobacteriota bacterium]
MTLKSFFTAVAMMLLAQAGISQEYDVVVIGGTPTGVSPAIAAAWAGKKAVIVEQSPVL